MFTSMFKDLQALYAARHEPESIQPLAEVYWRLLLSIGLIMVVVIIGYGTWEFFGVINNLSSADASGPPRSATLNRIQLQNTLEALRARQQEFDVGQSTVTPDPSQ